MNRVMYPYEHVASQLQIARLNLNLSQRQLSALSGISQSTICRYESGTSKQIDVQNVRAIAHILNLNTDF